jgi:hypothetical protein
MGAKPRPQDYAKVAEMEHPMSANMRDPFHKTLTENPRLVHEMSVAALTSPSTVAGRLA